ncbi:hypothetical protein PC116_g23887 [Phytophthora cactorum]|nr:hypothetical protein PC119_g21759 [Phytophthora cactorum]KAG3135266.1 hypothetical protein C6341_g21836 [Phytophthora cactorum]KAG4227739.1 hypothetical protein PC116_g23887 [Phytophthora cactorum]
MYIKLEEAENNRLSICDVDMQNTTKGNVHFVTQIPHVRESTCCRCQHEC